MKEHSKNIIINGVNLGVVFRKQFYSLMKSENNNIDQVIEKATSNDLRAPNSEFNLSVISEINSRADM